MRASGLGVLTKAISSTMTQGRRASRFPRATTRSFQEIREGGPPILHLPVAGEGVVTQAATKIAKTLQSLVAKIADPNHFLFRL